MSTMLKISDAANLAFHSTVYLAANPGELISTGEIAEALGVSENHLSKVLQRLSRAGLVKSIRGPKGGFVLEKPADRISLLDVFEAIEGRLEPTDCLLAKKVCDGNCILGGLLTEIDTRIKEYMAKTKLSELTGAIGGILK